MGHSRGQVLITARLEPATSAPVLSSRVPEVPPLLLSRIQIPHHTEKGVLASRTELGSQLQCICLELGCKRQVAVSHEPGFCFPVHPRFMCI